MDKILDREEKEKETNFWKNSWFVVLAANAILILMSLYKTYSFFSSSLLQDLPFLMKISFFADNLSFLMLICNLVLLCVSLFFSTTYWKKWLVMVIVGLVLYGTGKATYSFFDFDKIINSL